MKKIFIAVTGLLLGACTSVQSRSVASEDMQDVILPVIIQNEKNGNEVSCPFASKLNAAKDKKQRFAMLSQEAAHIKQTSHMILTSEPKGSYYCDESKMLQEQTYELLERSLCFEFAVGKYYDLNAMKKHSDYAKYKKAYSAKLANVDKVQNFNRPLSGGNCYADYMSYFKEAPLEVVIPLANYF